MTSLSTFPPPHRILFEPLNDRSSHSVWNTYVAANKQRCDFEEVDAAVVNSIDDFAPWITQWMSFVPSQSHIRMRVLIVWHAHFLTAACQQMLRRSLEQRSFRCRIWFHIEEPLLQPAIVSRCIVTRMPVYTHVPELQDVIDVRLWTEPHAYEKGMINKEEG
jgi:DNA polymerase III delta prime subunit